MPRMKYLPINSKRLCDFLAAKQAADRPCCVNLDDSAKLQLLDTRNR